MCVSVCMVCVLCAVCVSVYGVCMLSVCTVCVCVKGVCLCFGCMFPLGLQFRKSGILPGTGLTPIPHFTSVTFRTKAENAEDS